MMYQKGQKNSRQKSLRLKNAGYKCKETKLVKKKFQKYSFKKISIKRLNDVNAKLAHARSTCNMFFFVGKQGILSSSLILPHYVPGLWFQ